MQDLRIVIFCTVFGVLFFLKKLTIQPIIKFITFQGLLGSQCLVSINQSYACLLVLPFIQLHVLFVFSTEKSLVDCAYNLRAELENAAADVSGLFSKIG